MRGVRSLDRTNSVSFEIMDGSISIFFFYFNVLYPIPSNIVSGGNSWNTPAICAPRVLSDSNSGPAPERNTGLRGAIARSRSPHLLTRKHASGAAGKQLRLRCRRGATVRRPFPLQPPAMPGVSVYSPHGHRPPINDRRGPTWPPHRHSKTTQQVPTSLLGEGLLVKVTHYPPGGHFGSIVLVSRHGKFSKEGTK